MVELFSGSGNMARAFRKEGYKTLTIDLEQEADIQKDIRDVTAKEIIKKLGGRPNVLWASPPCTAFSVVAISRNWENRYPTSKKAMEGIALLCETIRLIMQLKPQKWYIENPRGMMRSLPFLEFVPRRTFTFCQYGDNAQKPTDVFTNVQLFFPKKCSPGAPCHDPQPRGYRAKKDLNAHKNMGTQGKNNAYERGKLPPEFCKVVAGL